MKELKAFKILEGRTLRKRLSATDRLRLFEYATQVKDIDVPKQYLGTRNRPEFLADAVELALSQDRWGCFRLFQLLAQKYEELNTKDKRLILNELAEILKLSEKDKKREKYRINFLDREAIKLNLTSFKAALALEIDRKGGVNDFSNLIGMPQSTLSSILNGDSMISGRNLNKIAVGLEKDFLEV